MAAAARIFRRAFAQEHESRYRAGAQSTGIEPVWSFIRAVEPHGFLAAREDGNLVGYAIFVSSLKRLRRQAVLRGAVFRWFALFARGDFGLRWSALPALLASKVMFLRSAGRYRRVGDAQLLNIAVDPQVRARGAATQLVLEGLRAMRDCGVAEIRLEVRPWNAGALRVYERTGWREVGRTRDMEGEWIVMVAATEKGNAARVS